MTEKHCVNVWDVDPESPEGGHTTPRALCPGTEYSTKPGFIWISSGFDHGGDLQQNPPPTSVPKWTDRFNVFNDATYSFDTGYCLNEIAEGILHLGDSIGLSTGKF